MNSKQYFENILKLVNHPKQHKFYSWLIANGSYFKMKGRRVDDNFYRWYQPQAGACYYNCQILTVEHPEKVKYYEGVAISKLGVPLDHAFITINGKVHDPTWADGFDYFGVNIPVDFIRKIWTREKHALPLIPFYYMEVVLNGKWRSQAEGSFHPSSVSSQKGEG